MPLDFHDRFLALVAGPDRTPIRAEAPSVGGDSTTAVLRLYDPVDSWGGTWGVSAKEFASVLDELPDSTQTIELHINSPGGETWDALAILNQLRQHPARYVAVVDGVAASAASFIAAGADELVMAPNSELFVHRAWGLVVGNTDDMSKFAGELEHFDRNLASIYAAKAGGSIDDWLGVMSDERWYSANEAVEVGLADRVDQAAPDATAAKARLDLSVFNQAGRKTGSQHPPPGPKAEKGGSSMDPVQLRTSLGLAEDATDEQVTERAAALEHRAQAAEARVAELEQAGPKGVPDGFELVPKGTGDQLAAASTRIEALEAKDHVRERDAFLAKWQRKFMPAARAEIETTYDEMGPEKLAALFEKSPDVVPLNELGTQGHDLDTEAEKLDRDYRALFGEEVPS